MRRVAFLAALLVSSAAHAASYTSYPAGTTPTGTEIFGPVRQGNKDVTLTYSQILAGWTSNINISGGVINGTPVGATTPSTGNFTKLTADSPAASTFSVLDSPVHGSLPWAQHVMVNLQGTTTLAGQANTVNVWDNNEITAAFGVYDSTGMGGLDAQSVWQPASSKVGLYSACVGNPNGGGCWASNFLVSMQSGFPASSKANGLEIDIGNNSGVNRYTPFNTGAAAPSGSGSSTVETGFGMSIVGGGANSLSAGLSIGTSSLVGFERGVSVGNSAADGCSFCSYSANMAQFYADSSSTPTGSIAFRNDSDAEFAFATRTQSNSLHTVFDCGQSTRAFSTGCLRVGQDQGIFFQQTTGTDTHNTTADSAANGNTLTLDSVSGVVVGDIANATAGAHFPTNNRVTAINGSVVTFSDHFIGTGVVPNATAVTFTHRTSYKAITGDSTGTLHIAAVTNTSNASPVAIDGAMQTMGGINDRIALKVTTTSTSLAYATMDGALVSTTNGYCPGDNTAATGRVSITGIDKTAAGRFHFTAPFIAYDRATGAASASASAGTGTQATGSGAGSGMTTGSVSVDASTANGCLRIGITPPNTDTWNWTATVDLNAAS